MSYQSLVMGKEERDTILQTINEAFLKKGMNYTVTAEDYEVRGGDFWVIIQKAERKLENKELNSEIEKSKSEIVPDYRDGWRLKEGDTP